MPEDVQVAVICPDFVPGVFRAVPLIEYFLDYVFVSIDSEPDRSFISFPSRVALDLHLIFRGLETFYCSRLATALWDCAMKQFHVNRMIVYHQTSAENVFSLDSHV